MACRVAPKRPADADLLPALRDPVAGQSDDSERGHDQQGRRKSTLSSTMSP